MSVTQITDSEIKTAINVATDILKAGLGKFTHEFKKVTSVNNYYEAGGNFDWTEGFLTGQYWLAWELTGDDVFKQSALVQVESFDKRVREEIHIDFHDLGFLYSLSCVAACRLVGSAAARDAAILAADALAIRFQKLGGFIQAWGVLGEKRSYRMIIDCLLNLPLLYWASEETGDDKYRKVAEIHTETSLKHLIRDDFSAYHTFFFDPEDGKPLYGATHQGYKDSSPWARGQAWGIYGLAVSYLYTKNPTCIELFYNVTDFFIDRLKNCADMVPYWDLTFTDDDNEPKDSSAAAIAACGMMEMVKFLPQDKAVHYSGVAKQLAGSLARKYAATPDISNGLLLHGVYQKSSQFNGVSDNGADECTLWGDYFWLELLMRLDNENWKIYW